MPIKLIGKSVLGDLGLCQVPSKMNGKFNNQLKLVEQAITEDGAPSKLLMTSMTGSNEVKLTHGNYFPKIRIYSGDIEPIFDPHKIMGHCELGLDQFRPGADFIVWNEKFANIAVSTFSREAPVLAFENSIGIKCLGTILRPSLMVYGDYLFDTIEKSFGSDSTVTLVACNHYGYKNRYGEDISIPTIVKNLASKHNMNCVIPADSDSEKNPECYHRGEEGNHVVVMW